MMQAESPTDAELAKLASFSGTARDFIAEVGGLWWPPTYAVVTEEVENGKAFTQLRLATGGRSGNEDVVSAIKDTFFHTLFWEMSQRDGRHTYRIDAAMLGRRISPRRLQQHATTGWKAPAGAVFVGRRTPWANPFSWVALTTEEGLEPGDAHRVAAEKFADAIAAGDLPAYPSVEDIRADLAGKDLVCWCPIDQPCHADVLSDIANTTPSTDKASS